MVQLQLSVLKKRLVYAQQQKDLEGELTTLLVLGATHQDKGHKKLALQRFGEAVALTIQSKRYRESSGLYIRMAQLCERMTHRQKALHYYSEAISCLWKVKDLSVQEISAIGCYYVIMATLENALDTAHHYYLLAREAYRLIDHEREEANCWLAEAKKYFDCWDYKEGLGYMRYGIDLLKRLTPPPDVLEEAKQRLQAMGMFLQQEYSEHAYQQFLRESAIVYAAAAAEAENEQKKRQEYQRDLTVEVKWLGLLRHEQGRKEVDAIEAVQMIQTHGFSRVAIPFYQEVRQQFRNQHNRLGEALITGTIMLIEQAKGISTKEALQTLLSLYRDADQDILGQIRAIYNYGVAWGQSNPYKDFQNAVAYVHCALLGLQHASQIHEPTLKTQGKKCLARWHQHMNSHEYQQALQTGEELFATHLAHSHPVSIWCASLQRPSRWSMLEEQETSKVATVPHLLAATRFVLDAMIEEASKPVPAAFEWEARRQHEAQALSALTTGHSLSQWKQPDMIRSFRIRFLEWHFSSNDGTPQEGFEPASRNYNRAWHGIQEYTYDLLLERILAYLDRSWLDHIMRLLTGYAVELLNDADQIVGCISWDHRCYSRVIFSEHSS